MDEVEDEEEDLNWYYAVAIGRCRGIFTSLNDALRHTRSYSYATFKKSPAFEEAHEFLNQYVYKLVMGTSTRTAPNYGSPMP